MQLVPSALPSQTPTETPHDKRIESNYTAAFRRLIYVRPNVPFDVDNRPYLRAILECDTPEMTLQCGRQIGKSVTIGGKELLHGTNQPYIPHLYIAPTGKQVNAFVRLNFEALIRLSPYLRKFIPTNLKEEVWQQGMKQLTNGSVFIFRSAYRSADAIRGLSCEHVVKDEMQDLISDHMPVVDEVTANWPNARFLNAGTPKTFSNLLERTWQTSTMAEWLIKCKKCNYWNFQDLSMVGAKGYICKRCGADINIQNGQWVMQNGSRRETHQGFRVTQFMNPNTAFWRIKQKLERYPMSRFYNEVLGLSYAEGSAVVSREDIVKCCNEERTFLKRLPAENPYLCITAGIDHGTGAASASRKRGDSQVSYTVLTIGGFDTRNGKWTVLFMHKFTGPESELSIQPKLLDFWLREFKVEVVFSDWGFGEPNNRRMINEYGWLPNQFFSVFESHTLADSFLKWKQESNMYVINRNEMFLKVIESIKSNEISFPRLADMEMYIPDFTSIYLELDAEKNTRRYDHTDPDDAFHSTAFAYIAGLKASKLLSRWTNKPVFYR